MNRARLSRPIYILARFAEMLIAAGSRVLNAAVFGGSTHQTVSDVRGMTKVQLEVETL